MRVRGAVAQCGELVDQLQQQVELLLSGGRIYSGRSSPHWTGCTLQQCMACGVDVVVC